MFLRHRVPVLAALVLVASLAVGTTGDAGAQSLADCLSATGAKEIYGPTDVNAQSANQGLAVGVNGEGTMSVFRWPSPSYYDQIRYTTEDRDLPRLGVAPSDGAFLGLRLDLEDGSGVTSWLRDWETEQRHVEGPSDEIVTEHREDELGLTARVRDVVAHPDDVFARQVTLQVDEGSSVRSADLMAYENLSLVVTKQPLLPVRDWCYESLNTDTARFDADLDAIVHELAGTDESTDEPSSAAIAMGFATPSDAVQIGWDPAEPVGEGVSPGAAQGALGDAEDGELTGNTELSGHTTGVLAVGLDLADGEATETVLFATGPDAAGAAQAMTAARNAGYEQLVEDKEAWIGQLVADAPLPDTDDPAVLEVARRAVIALVTSIDRETSAIVASIATQSPYGEDWPRDGAFFDYALDLIGLHDLVDEHHDFYAEVQQTAEDPDPVMTGLGVPPGNWAMNYYADGVVGGPIPWEIDETGYTLWNVWEHFRATDDEERLRTMYPTVQAAADFLEQCRDESNGLQCAAFEDDNFELRQTIVGASTVWLGLDAATDIATQLGEDDDAARWEARRDELGAAIDTELWTGDSYGAGSAPLLWPVCYEPADPGRLATQADAVWANISPSFDEPGAGAKPTGQYEAKGLLALAKLWKDDPERLGQVRDGLRWVATEHATPDTRIMGEAWELRDGDVISVVSQPHLWEQVLFYLAALEAWPPAEVADAPADCDGVLAALRDRTDDGSATGPAEVPTPIADGDGGVGAGVWVAAALAALVVTGGLVALTRRRRTRS